MRELIKSLFALLLLISTNSFSQPNYPTEADKGKLIYTDVENFLNAYAKLNPYSDTIDILKTHYFDLASIGLKEYITRHGLTPEMLRTAIASNQEHYEKLNAFFSKIETFESRYTATLKTFKKVVPSAMFPPTYLLVGAHRGIAQGSKVGQLVTITKMLDSEEHLLKFIIHELSHFQQAMTMGISTYSALFSKEKNMLGLCLREGGAELITKLVINDITQTEALKYLNNNRQKLKKRFVEDLSAQEKKYWLWESLENKETPKLLGYAMGFEICEAYYKQSQDKKQAIQDILGIVNPEEFLIKSTYITN